MGYLVYGLVRVIEATLFYLLAFFVARQLKSPIQPIGSQAYIIFVVVWPFVAPLLRPGLRTIPIIGGVFALFDGLARSCLGTPKPADGGGETKPSETTKTSPEGNPENKEGGK
jgi:hypothetical protein